MQSNYKRLGDYIREVKLKNTDDSISELLGINIDKFFMPSVANIVGTDLSKYKVVKKNQFACNRMHVGRDERIPVAISDRGEPFIVSPAYDVFEIIDETILIPEYLMMWFKRKEFDRNAWFYTDGDVRGGLRWNDFIDLKLPIPSIEKQKELVAEYQTIENRIRLNNTLCEKLEETAQTLYRHWFEDFEFPVIARSEAQQNDEAISTNQNLQVAEPTAEYRNRSELVAERSRSVAEQSRSYKSSGGEMIYSEELGKEIPKGWKVGNIADMRLEISDGNYSSKYPKASEFVSDGIPFIRGTDFNNKFIDNKNLLFISPEKHSELRKGHLKINDVLMSNRANIGAIAYVTKKFVGCNINSQLLRINGGEIYSQFYLGCLFNSLTFKNYLVAASTGSAQLQLPVGNFLKIRLLKPSKEVIKLFTKEYKIILTQILLHKEQNQKLEELKSLLLGKMAVER